MSELRIALVSEGPTDTVIIDAALKAVLGSHPFILTQLQPEPTNPNMGNLGNGWGGVLKWCHAASQRYTGSLDDDPTLEGFDLLVLHLDADVAQCDYADCGQKIVDLAHASSWLTLPCAQPCPPPIATVNQLEAVLRSWLGNATPGNKTLICIPAQASGTWLAAAVLPPHHRLRNGIECNTGVESSLSRLPVSHRIKKRVPEYRAKADAISARWGTVKAQCSQALIFEQILLAKI